MKCLKFFNITTNIFKRKLLLKPSRIDHLFEEEKWDWLPGMLFFAEGIINQRLIQI